MFARWVERALIRRAYDKEFRFGFGSSALNDGLLIAVVMDNEAWPVFGTQFLNWISVLPQHSIVIQHSPVAKFQLIKALL